MAKRVTVYSQLACQRNREPLTLVHSAGLKITEPRPVFLELHESEAEGAEIWKGKCPRL
jgi:hypothetical protein